MTRPAFIAGMAALIAVWAMIAVQVVASPVARSRARFEQRLAETHESGPASNERRQVRYEELRRLIADKPALWRPVVEVQQAPDAAPDWKAILGNVIVSQVVGEGDGIRIKLKAGPQDVRGQWVTKGAVFNGATVKEIADSGIVFVKVQNGKEYSFTLPR